MKFPINYFAMIIIFSILVTSCNEKIELAKETIRSSFKPKPRNVSLILDTSGSMNRNDADRMTLYSTILFIDLLEPIDHLSILSFPTRKLIRTSKQLNSQIEKWIASPEGIIIDKSNSDMKTWVKSLQYDSNFTIFSEPLEKSFSVVSKGDEDSFSQRVIVFFSDGGTDRHNLSRVNKNYQKFLKEDHRKETELVCSRMIPKLLDKNITFYGVALGQETVTNHFDCLSDSTGGLVRRVSDPEDLAQNFTEIFGKILQTEVENKTFSSKQVVTQTINNYVKELLIIIPTRKLDDAKKLSLHLSEPGSQAISDSLEIHTSSKQKSSPELWERTTSIVDGLKQKVKGNIIDAGGYAIWKIKKPNAGKWKIRLEGLSPVSAKAILIQNYGIYLEVEGRRNRFGMVGEPNAFKARLVTDEGEPIIDPSFYEKHNFRFEFRVDGKQLSDIKPNENYYLVYDYIPPTVAKNSKIGIHAKNDLFLNVKVPITFTAHKDVRLEIKGRVNFGQRIPWTDWFLEKIGSILGDAIWTKGDKWNRRIVEVDFKGSAQNAVGVRFKLDNSKLFESMKSRILSPDGGETFYLDKDMKARFCIDIDRDSKGGNLSDIKVPITTVSGKDVSGITNMPVEGFIEPLSPLSWKYSHFWLEELLILWLILYIIGKPLVYVSWNSFPKSKVYFAGSNSTFKRELKKGNANKAAKTPMGRTILIRPVLGYFQFLWGKQISENGTRIRSNQITRFYWFILSIFLPISMADSKKIFKFKFYRYKGQTLISEIHHDELLKLESGSNRPRQKNEKSKDPRVLKPRENVNCAKFEKGKKILHIP